MVRSFPLLVLSLVVFAGLNLVDGGPEKTVTWHEAEAFRLSIMSGDVWRLSGGDVFLLVSLVLFFVELLQATRTGGASLINHSFSVLVFIASLILFLTRPGYGNSVFFLFMMMTLLDFLAGFIITTVSAQRDVTLSGSPPG